jgi:hypothetical protein
VLVLCSFAKVFMYILSERCCTERIPNGRSKEAGCPGTGLYILYHFKIKMISMRQRGRAQAEIRS